MDRVNEKAVRLMCENLNLEYYYDTLAASYIFKRRVNPNDISQSLERCFGEELEYIISVYTLRHVDPISLYKRLTEVFGDV